MSTMEQPIVSGRASVMVYDDVGRKWIPSGTSSGLSRVHIFQNSLMNTFRIVGRKLQDQELVIDFTIPQGLKYNTATPTFHNWRDNRQVYGLNFSSREDAHNFAETMTHILEILNPSSSPSSSGINNMPQSIVPNVSTNNSNHVKQTQQIPQPPQQQQAPIPPQPVYGHTRCPQPDYSEAWGVNSGSTPNSHPAHNSNWTNSDMNEWKQAQVNDMNNVNHHHHINQSANHNAKLITSSVPVPPSQATYGHHKPPSTAPNNPGMINLSQTGQVQSPIQSGQPPQLTQQSTVYSSRPEMPFNAPPSSQPAPIPPPPPLPPPLTNLNSNATHNLASLTNSAGTMMSNVNTNNVNNNIKMMNPMSNLASALTNVKLKKATGRDEKDSDNSSKSSSSGSIGVGMASMMDEMNRTLARRRALAEGNQNQNDSDTSGGDKRNWDNKVNANRNSPNKDSSEPNSQRLRAGSLDTSTMNGIDQLKIDQLKQEILNEIRKEINKMKSDIIEAIKLQLRG